MHYSMHIISGSLGPLQYVLQAMAQRRTPTTPALVLARARTRARVRGLAQVASFAVGLVHLQIDVRKAFARATLARRDMSQAV